ncbi:hypothetical protein K435DRAFT_875990 [Dendrothele bispora CBS 962.96]|uniref:Uncharacterized protein n=1 Tax=Dendrothele bispora (strain CBS 962.96) TaxID=1314807 RepID=A0A4V6T4Y1_DENBC|nr:hypothetical protein K435DRAFT_875990 [Dendrothele bispora CBS 962.96]
MTSNTLARWQNHLGDLKFHITYRAVEREQYRSRHYHDDISTNHSCTPFMQDAYGNTCYVTQIMSNSTIIPAETYLASTAFAESFKKVDFNSFSSVYNDAVRRTRYLQDLEEELLKEANRLSREEFLHNFNSFITKGSNHFHTEARKQLRLAADDLTNWPQPLTYADVLKEPKDPWNCATFDECQLDQNCHLPQSQSHRYQWWTHPYGYQLALYNWEGNHPTPMDWEDFPRWKEGEQEFWGCDWSQEAKKEKGKIWDLAVGVELLYRKTIE